jgi:hypothetical protein
MMFVSFNNTTTDATSGTGTANPAEAHEFRPSGLYWVLYCTIFTLLCSVLW